MKKHFLLTMVIALASLACSQAQASIKSVKLGTDSITVVDGTDTIRVAGTKALMEKIKADLDSPLIDSSSESDDESFNDADTSDSYYNENYYQNEREERLQNFRIVSLVMTIVCFTIVGIIFFCLLFFFLNRRRKYEMIEKAIENNYQLPSSVTGIYPQASATAPHSANGTQDKTIQPDVQDPQDFQATYAQQYDYQSVQQGYEQNVPGQYNLSKFKSSLCWLAVGFIGVFSSLCSQADFFVYLFLVPLTIGIVKGINEFLTQRSRVEHEKWQMQQNYYNRYAEKKQGDNLWQDNGDNTTPPPFQTK